MAQVLNLCSPTQFCTTTRRQNDRNMTFIKLNLKCNGKFFCLFSNNRREEQARKALEGALGGKKNEFEKWDKEIKKREEVGGGRDVGGGGGWFGWGGRFGGSNGDRFWGEAQQTSLAVLGIIVMYLIIVKGEAMLAVIINPLLYALRGSRNGLTFIRSWIFRTPTNQAAFDNPPTNEGFSTVSAKERVVRKWGSD